MRNRCSRVTRAPPGQGSQTISGAGGPVRPRGLAGLAYRTGRRTRPIGACRRQRIDRSCRRSCSCRLRLSRTARYDRSHPVARYRQVVSTTGARAALARGSPAQRVGRRAQWPDTRQRAASGPRGGGGRHSFGRDHQIERSNAKPFSECDLVSQGHQSADRTRLPRNHPTSRCR